MFSDLLRQRSERDDTLLAGTADLQVTSIVSLLAIAVLVGPFDTPTALNAALAVPLFCFLPGYALLAALFPARAGEDTPDRTRPAGSPPLVDRLALAVALSLGIVPMTAVLLSPIWGVDVTPTLVALAAVTLVAVAVAVLRRAKVSRARRFAPLSALTPRSLLPHSSSGRFLIVAAVLAAAIAGASAAYAASTDEPASTEFYLVNESDGGVALGNATDDARPVAIEHHAEEDVTYTVVVREYSSDTDVSEATRETVSIEGSERVVLSAPSVSPGADRVEYLLYEGEPGEDPDADDAIRQLWMTVVEE